jgi:hypothetical protein
MLKYAGRLELVCEGNVFTSGSTRSINRCITIAITTLDKARPHTENIRGSNLAAVTCTTVQVSKTAVLD